MQNRVPSGEGELQISQEESRTKPISTGPGMEPAVEDTHVYSTADFRIALPSSLDRRRNVSQIWNKFTI